MLQEKTKRVLSLATALLWFVQEYRLPDSNVSKGGKKAKLKTNRKYH